MLLSPFLFQLTAFILRLFYNIWIGIYFFLSNINQLIFPQSPFRPHSLSVAIKLLIPCIAVSCPSSPVKMPSFTTSWKRCNSPSSCCTSTSRLLATQQLSAMKIYFSRPFFPFILPLSLKCTHPQRRSWIYALFGWSLPCTLKRFRSATVCL